MREERVRLLLVDDELSVRLPLKRYLENNFGYHVDAAADSQEALHLVEENQGQYDVALIDEVLLIDEEEPPDEADGIQLMQQIRARYPEVEAIIFTGWGREARRRALRAGAFRHLEKPVDHDELAMLIRTAAQQVRLRTISREILSQKDPDRVLESILVAASSLALANEAAIVLLDRASERLRVHTRTYPAEPKWQRHFRNQNLSREIMQSGQVVRVPDTSQDERVNPRVLDAGIYSFLGLPIPGEEGNLGVLYVYSQRNGWFEEWGTVAVLQTLAGQAGLALANAQAFRQIDDHARYMEALVRAGQGLTQATRLEDQLALAWDFVREQLQVSTFFVVLYDCESQTLHFPLVYDEGERLTIQPKKKGEGWGISGYVIESGEEMIWATSDERTQQGRRMGIDPIQVGKACQSCIYLPLRVGESVIGAVSIQSYRPHAFPSVLLDAFRALGSQLAVALENARLFEAEARRRREAETLREAVLGLSTTLQQDKVFETILAELQKVVPYDSASVQLLQGDLLEIIGGRGFPNLPELLGISFLLDGDNPHREVVRRRGPFIVADAPSVYKGFTEEPHVQAGIRGWMGVPMLVGEQLIGMIALDKREPGFYTEEHARLAQAFATQAAIAIENARLFSELAEAKEWREALIENAHDALIAIDQDKRITVYNRRAEEMLGWTAKEMVGQTVARLQTDLKKAQEIFDLVNREGAVSDWEVELKHRRGDHIPTLLSATQITDSQGRPIGQAGFIRDLRQARLLEDRLRAMIRVNKAITETLDLDQVFQLVIESAMLAFPAADGGSIHLYDERTDLLHIRADTSGYSQAAVEASRFHVGEGIAGWVFQHDQPTVVDDVEKDPRPKAIDHPEVPVHKSMICVPLRVRERVIGTLSLDNLERTEAFQPEDLGLLSTFADQAAIAIDNARRMEELEKLRQAAEAMSRAIEPRQALQQIVRSAAQVLEADSAAIWSYDAVRDKFIPEALTAVGIPPDELERFREEEPKPGRTADTVMSQGYLAVTDILLPEHSFLGGATHDLLQRIGVRSFQGIALQVGDERLGVLYVNYNRTRAFHEEDEATLRTFASHAALTLKNARLLTQMQRTQEAAGVIAGVTVQEDLNQTLGTIARHTQKIMGSDAVTLYAYDETTGQFGGWAAEILEARHPESMRPADKLAPGSVVGRLLNLSDPPYYRLVEGYVIHDALLGGHFTRAEGMQATIGLQLRVGERKVGVMFVSFRSPHRFTSDEVATIQLFADQAAVAIRNAQLYSEASRLYKQAQLIADISREAAQRLELDAFLRTLFTRLKQVFEEREIPVYLSLATYDDETTSLNFHRTDFHPRKLPSGAVPLDTPGIMTWVANTRELRYAPDVSRDEHHLGIDPDTQSEVAVPVLFDEQLLGVLDLESPVVDAFTSDDLRLLQTLANQVATTIRNVQQYEELRRARGLVGARTALAWMGMVSSAWRHATDKYALTIREQAQLLRMDWQSVSRHLGDTRVPERIATIERLATQILDRPITPPLSIEEGVKSVSLNTLVGERARQLWRNDPYRQAGLMLDLKLSEQVTVRASPEWLRRAFDILVDNAVDAVTDRSVRKITISTQLADGGAEILVSDTGPGIPQEIQSQIGLELIKRPEDVKGLGMGLLMAQTIVQTYGGEIRVDSTGPTGTTMVIRLPLEEQGQ